MTLVGELRSKLHVTNPLSGLLNSAADEIERLRSENERLRGHRDRLQADIEAIKRYG